jgi:hypothetical protein
MRRFQGLELRVLALEKVLQLVGLHRRYRDVQFSLDTVEKFLSVGPTYEPIQVPELRTTACADMVFNELPILAVQRQSLNKEVMFLFRPPTLHDGTIRYLV